MSSPNVTVKVPITITAKLLTAAEAQKKLADRKAAADKARQASEDAQKAKPIDDSGLDQIFASIKSSEPGQPQQALDKLAHSTPVEARRDEVTSVLVGLLNDRDQFTVTGAEKALKLWGNDGSVAPLMKLLSDKDFFIRTGAMDALVPHKNAEIAESIAKQLPDFSVRQQASQALQAMGDVAEKPVQPMLANSDQFVRVTACEILGAIGTSQSIDPLQAAAGDENLMVQNKANSAIKSIQSRLNPSPPPPAQ
jgi:HEAT repeat protein